MTGLLAGQDTIRAFAREVAAGPAPRRSSDETGATVVFGLDPMKKPMTTGSFGDVRSATLLIIVAAFARLKTSCR